MFISADMPAYAAIFVDLWRSRLVSVITSIAWDTIARHDPASEIPSMRNSFPVGVLLALSCGTAWAAENGNASDNSNRGPAAQANPAARACVDRSEERRLMCVSVAMSDVAKQACYRTHEDEVKVKCPAAAGR